MLCEKCGKAQATTHIRSVVNGEIYEKHLCNQCAASEGYGDINGKTLTQMLSSMFDDASSVLPSGKPTRCSCCGSMFADISKSGKCGCSECYKTFYSELLPYLKRVHGSTEHIGKIPSHTISDVQDYEETIQDLRKLLKELVSNENYEQAAVIRDKIKKLEETP